MDAVLVVRDLRKTYTVGRIRRRKVCALDGVDLTVRRGDVYGFLGENGAGKTTTVRCVLGLAFPDAGTIDVLGERSPRPERLFARVAYCPEDSNFFTGLTGRELLDIYGRLHGLAGAKLAARVGRVLEEVDLAGAADRRIGGYSKGMKQRLGLAQSILPEPEFVVLDEPSRGLDPVGRRRFRDVIADYAARGTTFFINSHALSEVEQTCNRVGIIHQGRLVRELSPGELIDAGGGLTVRYRVPGDPLEGTRGPDGAVTADVADTAALAALAAKIADAGGTIETVEPRRTSLEDYFIRVVGAGETIA
ncbi:ABC transporter ATP-binding protein [bacterium]|nr:ABC transporter ATP-binding protein [bacterium]